MSARSGLGRWGWGLVLSLLLALPVLAQKPDPPSEETTKRGDSSGDTPEGLGTDEPSRAAFRLLAAGKYIDAREAAEAILKKQPSSYAAHYVIGFTLHRAEGSLAMSLYHLKLARKFFEAKYGVKPEGDQPWLWHASILEELASVAGEMGLHVERLAYLEARDAAYDPKWPAERGWPLMRLRRYKEARAAIEEGLKSEQVDQISTAKTTLCAVESELLKRREAYVACMDAITYDRDSNQGGPHSYTNAAGSAMGLLKMDEAESLILEGTKHFQDGATANPWEHLMWLYIGEGRSVEALEAVREMFNWQRAQPAYMDEQARAEIEVASALFLLVAGRASDAARILDRTMDRPDRTGFTSADSEQMEAATALLDMLANRMAAERSEEEASWSGWEDWAEAKVQARRFRVRSWEAARRGASLIQGERVLEATLRPYLAGSVAVPEWMEGDLCEVLGAGVVDAALERARKAEDLTVLPEAAAYFDAFEAEVALLQGRTDDALRVAVRSLDALPRGEVLLQARVAAIGGEAALQDGKTNRAIELYDRALQLDPGVVRRLGFAIPTRFIADGEGPVGRLAVTLLKRSPRFLESDSGFTVRVEGAEDSGTACLSGPQSSLIACANVTPRAGETPKDVARRLVAELHEQAFAPRLDITQSDLRSLDGSTTTGGDRTAQRFKSLMDSITGNTSEETPP